MKKPRAERGGGRNPFGAGLCALFLALSAIALPRQAIAQAAANAPANAPVSARELLASADRLRFSEDWYGAIETYLAALAKNPSYGEALASLAECYYQIEEYDQALSYAKRASPFLKADTTLADLEGFIRVGAGDLPGARKSFEGVIARVPNDLDARFGLALLDLAVGKKTEARLRLEESLRISPQNARALLSLALVSSDQGRIEDARALAEKALRYHGSQPRTQFVAARLAAAEGDRDRAAFHARNALDLKPSYGEARLLLGSLMYEGASFDQAILLMREAVTQNRRDGMAWYTLGLAQSGAGKTADAIYSLKTASGLRPDDEIARIALENLVMDSNPVEDQAREAYADWHFKRGGELEDRSLYDQALFEYRRGLRIYPYSKKGRLLYAGLLKSRGYQGKYLDELEFLKDLGKADQATLDAIEIYNSLLVDTVGRAWSIDEASLPKRPYKVALMYQAAPGGRIHTAGEEVLLRYIKDLLSSSSRISVLALPARISSFAEAFRRARETETDYFILISSRETEREIEIGAELRVSRTGSPATGFKAYRTGNDRVKNTAARIVELIATALPPEGSILKRSQDRALVDLGKSDGIKAGNRLLILKNGSLQVKAEGLGHAFSASSVVGELEVLRAGEEACEGRLKSAGFFDTINSGDEVILAPAEKAAAASPGTATTTTSTLPAGSSKTSAAKSQASEAEWPGLFTAIRRLR